MFVIFAILVVLRPELDTMDKELDEKKLGIPTLPNYFLLSKYKMSGNPEPTAPGPGNTLVSTNSAAIPDNTGRKQVKVDLIANIDVTGNVKVFSTEGTTMYDVVVCDVAIPHTALYGDASNGVLEFVEDSNVRGTILGAVSSADGVSTLQTLNGFGAFRAPLAGSIQTAVCATGGSPIDASGASPFKDYPAAYQQFSSFGELVLGVYAHYLFGHVAATAAIANDDALVGYINGADASSAQIGINLVNALEQLSDGDATNIVRQVLSQDPNRALNRDNNQISPDEHQALEFCTGDIIYLTIRVAAPTVSTSDPGSGAPDVAGHGNVNLTTATSYPSTSPSFTLQITLS